MALRQQVLSFDRAFCLITFNRERFVLLHGHIPIQDKEFAFLPDTRKRCLYKYVLTSSKPFSDDNCYFTLGQSAYNPL